MNGTAARGAEKDRMEAPSNVRRRLKPNRHDLLKANLHDSLSIVSPPDVRFQISRAVPGVHPKRRAADGRTRNERDRLVADCGDDQARGSTVAGSIRLNSSKDHVVGRNAGVKASADYADCAEAR
jgi:hypothetical protein